jgi:pyruvate kinase
MNISDGVIVARGDLGLNIPFERLPLIQHQIINIAKSLNIYVIVATQMLESISENKVPHRSEIIDIATAVYQGASVLLLSGETRTGRNPVYTVKVLDKIIRQAEFDRINGFK